MEKVYTVSECCALLYLEVFSSFLIHLVLFHSSAHQHQCVQTHIQLHIFIQYSHTRHSTLSLTFSFVQASIMAVDVVVVVLLDLVNDYTNNKQQNYVHNPR